MSSRFARLSLRLVVERPGLDPTALLRTLLLGIVQRLGDGAVGHAKAFAQLDHGALHASTTGVPPEVHLTIAGAPEERTDRVELDLLCAFFGVAQSRMNAAWRDVRATLAQEGTTITARPEPVRSSEGSGARRSVLASVASSFLVLKPCCLIPALSSAFGASVGVLNVFAPLEPYRPAFIALSVALLGWSYYRLYWRPSYMDYGASAASVSLSRAMFWSASAVLVAAILYPLAVPTHHLPH